MENIALGRRGPAAEQAEKVGPYRLEHRLGSGGMGAVWRARDERLKRAVALKRILPAANEDPRLRERFRREAEAVARLNHPAIIHIYDIVETQESDWIVMELVEGWTLHELLRHEGPLDPQRVLRLGRDVAEGLAEAHAQGFIHRDLKTPNVMMTPSGRAKILDFGVAKQIHPEAQETTLSRPGTIVGTSYAMSPEQAMGLPLDARSDLFSLGSLLYEMVTGVAPFRADTAQATLARVCSFRQCPASDIRPDVPLELSDLIDRLLEKDPVRRPGSAAAVATALDRIAAKQTALPAGAQISREEAEAYGEETDLEIPVRQIQASSSFESTAGQPSPDVLPVTAEPARLSVRSAEQGSPLRRIRSLRTAIGIALLFLVVIVAAYSLRSPALQPTPHSLYQEGLTYLDRPDLKGNLDQAIDSFQKVLARDQTHAAAQAALARAYWFKFRSDSRDPMLLTWALSNADRAVALDPHLAAARVSLGLALMSDGRTDEAMRHIERALVLDPANGDAYYAAGRIHESQGNFKEAEAAYKKAAEIQPHRLNFDALGTLYYKMGRMEEAIAASRRSIELAPDGFIGYRNLGAAYHARGDLAEAASQFQKALQIRPDSTVYSNLGTVHFSRGFYQLSAEAFEKSLEMPGGANDYRVWGNLGDAYRWTPDQKERSRDAYLRAIQLVREQLRSAPGDVTLRSHLAVYLAKRGDLAEALEELHKLRDLPGKDAKAWLRMAVAHEVSAQRSEALAALGHALRAGASIQEVKDDPELLDLRADTRYHRLIAQLSKEP